MPHSIPMPRNSVAKQLMLRLAVIGSVFSLLTTVTAILMEYHDELGKIDAVFSDIQEGYLGSLVETAWLEDRDRLSLLAMGIGRLPNVTRVEVREPSGRIITSVGGMNELSDVSRTYPLVKEYKGQPVALGTLSVHASTKAIRDDALKNGWIYGLANLVLVAMASAFLYFMMRVTISQPLQRLALTAKKLGTGQHDVSFLSDIESVNINNEFGVLASTLSDMQQELKSTLDQLKASECRYRELFTNAPISLWEEDFSAVKTRLEMLKGHVDDFEAYLDANPAFVQECASLVKVVDVNDASLRVHGAKNKNELLGALFKVFTPSTLTAFKKVLLAIWNGAEEIVAESESRTLTGEVRELVVHWQVMPGGRERLKRVIVSHEDVTERVEARHSLAVTVERLMQANSELERFSHAAAHDLAEPVRSIVSFSQLLERSLKSQENPEVKDYLGFLVAAAKRMQAQVQGLQDYVRVGEGVENREQVELDAVAKRAMESLREPIRLTQAEIETSNLPVVYANAGQIADVFRNLIDNAVKFRRTGVPPKIRISAARHGGEWAVSVADNGIGIDPRYASDVFQIFRRLNPPSRTTGEGIGLSLCKRIIERHGGRMWVESSLGQGAVFHFTLPASDG